MISRDGKDAKDGKTILFGVSDPVSLSAEVSNDHLLAVREWKKKGRRFDEHGNRSRSFSPEPFAPCERGIVRGRTNLEHVGLSGRKKSSLWIGFLPSRLVDPIETGRRRDLHPRVETPGESSGRLLGSLRSIDDDLQNAPFRFCDP
jgi:hypothetical protein